MVCRGCGISVALRNPRRRHFYPVAVDSPLLPFISDDNNTYQDMPTIYACHACWVRANRHLIHNTSRDLQEDVVPSVEHGSSTPPPPLSLPPTPQPLMAVSPTAPPLLLLPPSPVVQRGARTALAVSLPNYKQASNTSSLCILNKCNNGAHGYTSSYTFPVYTDLSL